MSQAIVVAASIPTMIPRPLSRPPVTSFYLPELHDRTGNYISEHAIADLSLISVVSNIVGGEYPNLIRVIGVDVAAGRTWDASEEIAVQAFEQAIDYFGFIPAAMRPFLEEAIGVNTLRSMEREAA